MPSNRPVSPTPRRSTSPLLSYRRLLIPNARATLTPVVARNRPGRPGIGCNQNPRSKAYMFVPSAAMAGRTHAASGPRSPRGRSAGARCYSVSPSWCPSSNRTPERRRSARFARTLAPRRSPCSRVPYPQGCSIRGNPTRRYIPINRVQPSDGDILASIPRDPGLLPYQIAPLVDSRVFHAPDMQTG